MKEYGDGTLAKKFDTAVEEKIKALIGAEEDEDDYPYDLEDAVDSF